MYKFGSGLNVEQMPLLYKCGLVIATNLVNNSIVLYIYLKDVVNNKVQLLAIIVLHGSNVVLLLCFRGSTNIRRQI